MYSDLLNGEHFFFFSAYDFIASTRKSASSTMRKSRFRVKRSKFLRNRSIFISFSRLASSNHTFIAQRLSRSKHNNLAVIPIIIISFEKTRCNFRKRSNSIDTYLNFFNQLINVGYIKHRIKRRNNFFLNF